jgi:transcriptional regulator with XRE-family HTH domain
MNIGERIKGLRIKNNMTQPELAAALNCTRQKIADWERGKSQPSTSDLINLSKILETSSDYLLGLSDAPTSDKDLQYICDTIGLSKEAIETLSNTKLDIESVEDKTVRNIVLYFMNNFISQNLLYYHSLCASRYCLNVDMQKKVLNNAIKRYDNSEGINISEIDKTLQDLEDQADIALFKIERMTINFLEDISENIIGNIEKLQIEYKNICRKLKAGESNVNNPQT